MSEGSNEGTDRQLLLWPRPHTAQARKASYFATPAVQLVQALRVSLKQILAQTPDVNDRFAKVRV